MAQAPRPQRSTVPHKTGALRHLSDSPQVSKLAPPNAVPEGVIVAKRATRVRKPPQAVPRNLPGKTSGEKTDSLEQWTADWQQRRARALKDGNLEELLKVVPLPEITFEMKFPDELFPDELFPDGGNDEEKRGDEAENADSDSDSDDETESDETDSDTPSDWSSSDEGMTLYNSGYDPWKFTRLPAYFLYERNREICKKYQYPIPFESGKWMLFYDHENVNDAWRKARRLYNAGELDGIRSMKVSTGMDSDRAMKNTPTSVMIFYCGPASNEELMMTYGRSLLRSMEYEEQKSAKARRIPRAILYKTDMQTFQGTRATGCKKNWIYRLYY